MQGSRRQCKKIWRNWLLLPSQSRQTWSCKTLKRKPTWWVLNRSRWITLLSTNCSQERPSQMRLILCNSKMMRKRLQLIQTEGGVLQKEIKQGALVERPLNRTRRRRRVRNDRGGQTRQAWISKLPTSQPVFPQVPMSSSNSLRQVVRCQQVGCLLLQRTCSQAKTRSKLRCPYKIHLSQIRMEDQSLNSSR